MIKQAAVELFRGILVFGGCGMVYGIWYWIIIAMCE